ncbi:hypothetical protein HDU97_010007 [Phlyctochytrium planicorne]|nr:hypothetical protein HDU97_010007 [Phlyctochytrium planicorne]
MLAPLSLFLVAAAFIASVDAHAKTNDQGSPKQAKSSLLADPAASQANAPTFQSVECSSLLLPSFLSFHLLRSFLRKSRISTLTVNTNLKKLFPQLQTKAGGSFKFVSFHPTGSVIYELAVGSNPTNADFKFGFGPSADGQKAVTVPRGVNGVDGIDLSKIPGVRDGVLATLRFRFTADDGVLYDCADVTLRTDAVQPTTTVTDPGTDDDDDAPDHTHSDDDNHGTTPTSDDHSHTHSDDDTHSHTPDTDTDTHSHSHSDTTSTPHSHSDDNHDHDHDSTHNECVCTKTKKPTYAKSTSAPELHYTTKAPRKTLDSIYVSGSIQRQVPIAFVFAIMFSTTIFA